MDASLPYGFEQGYRRAMTDAGRPHGSALPKHDDLLAHLEPLWDADQMRAADRWTIDSLGVPGAVLMDQAGRFVADAAERMSAGGAVVVLCGPGNNGGDGWVCARHLFARGVPAMVLALKDPSALEGDARAAADAFGKAAAALGWRALDDGSPWRALPPRAELVRLLRALKPAVVVDALFGTGLGRALEGAAADTVLGLSSLEIPVLAVDLPSGLPTDGQAPAGPCVRATATLTFGGRKIAHATEPGRFLCGEVELRDIGVLWDEKLRAGAWVFAAPKLSSLRLPLPPKDAHKGRFGHVGVLAGSAETAGAARLCAHAALRAGAGLVTMLTDDPARTGPGDEPEVMRLGFDPERPDDALARLTVVVVGPGLGRSDEARARGRALLRAAAARDLPVVVDADALPLLLEDKLSSTLRAIATPHPGEAATLLDADVIDVQRDRHAAVEELLGQTVQVTWLLKGACPIVGGPAGRHIVVEGGAYPLAVGGSGDTLAGTLAALVAGGLPLELATVVGAVVHQEAGARLARSRRRGHTAREIADESARVLDEAWAR